MTINFLRREPRPRRSGTGCAGAWRETVLARVWLLEGTEAVHGAWLVAAHGKEP
ncbi:hypothetical protein PVK06_045142 [Gossypium arboreum]|uniref:Uncharacterized protein n=1 Tax=Gossypium arboreum TaxID=29729 RepID=A0ABR0MT95_GOSAR|nr:hypothetical protein PVK06_045142 [Gossypium arboreum]